MSYLPPTLKKLKGFDELLQGEGLSLDEGIGLQWADSSIAYDQTPYDVLPMMKKYTGCDLIENVYDYVEDVAALCRKQIVQPTKDGLGIVPFIKIGGDLPIYPIFGGRDISVEESQAFFTSAPLKNKLAFIRDA